MPSTCRRDGERNIGKPCRRHAGDNQGGRCELKPDQLVLEAGFESIVRMGPVTVPTAAWQSQEVKARACISSLPAPEVLEVVRDLSPQKRTALELMTPYTRSIATAWLVSDTGPLPWDDLLSLPVLAARHCIR